jgi:hypothetical protein
MSLSKKIAAMAAPIAVFAFLLAVPASAQAPASPKADSPKADSPKADTYPKADANISTPASESTHKKVEAHRHHWAKKHTPGTVSGTTVSHKPTVAHKVM